MDKDNSRDGFPSIKDYCEAINSTYHEANDLIVARLNDIDNNKEKYRYMVEKAVLNELQTKLNEMSSRIAQIEQLSEHYVTDEIKSVLVGHKGNSTLPLGYVKTKEELD